MLDVQGGAAEDSLQLRKQARPVVGEVQMQTAGSGSHRGEPDVLLLVYGRRDGHGCLAL